MWALLNLKYTWQSLYLIRYVCFPKSFCTKSDVHLSKENNHLPEPEAYIPPLFIIITVTLLYEASLAQQPGDIFLVPSLSTICSVFLGWLRQLSASVSRSIACKSFQFGSYYNTMYSIMANNNYCNIHNCIMCHVENSSYSKKTSILGGN